MRRWSRSESESGFDVGRTLAVLIAKNTVTAATGPNNYNNINRLWMRNARKSSTANHPATAPARRMVLRDGDRVYFLPRICEADRVVGAVLRSRRNLVGVTDGMLTKTRWRPVSKTAHWRRAA